MSNENENTDTPSLRSIRVRKHLQRWLVVVVIALVLVGVLGGWLVYHTHVEPGTVAEEETVASWNEETHLSHHAEVVRPNPVFDEGQTLSNQPVYFSEISPMFAGEHEYSYSASDGGELDIEIEAELRSQAVDQDGQPYWQQTALLDRTTEDGLAPGELALVEFEINVTEAVENIDRTETALGTSVGTTELDIVFNTRVSGTVNDERVVSTHQDRLLIEPDDGSYSVEPEDSVQETHETTQLVEYEATYGPLRSYAPFGLILASLVGLASLGVLKHRERVPPAETELALLEHHQEREEFDDWISRGQIPESSLDGPRIELDSLEDLVDVAIDTNNRVIEDATSGEFVVTDRDLLYTVRTQPSGGVDFTTTAASNGESLPENGDGPSESGCQNGGSAVSTDGEKATVPTDATAGSTGGEVTTTGVEDEERADGNENGDGNVDSLL